MDQGVRAKVALELESCRLKTIKAAGTKPWRFYCLFKTLGKYNIQIMILKMFR